MANAVYGRESQGEVDQTGWRQVDDWAKLEARFGRGGALVMDAMRRVREQAQLEELLLRYALGVALGDRDLWRSCFAEGGPAHRPAAPGREGGAPADGGAPAGLAPEGADANQHYYSVCSVQVENDEAEVTLCHRAGVGAMLDAPAFERCAYYACRCRRAGDGWKIVDVSPCSSPGAPGFKAAGAAAGDSLRRA